MARKLRATIVERGLRRLVLVCALTLALVGVSLALAVPPPAAAAEDVDGKTVMRVGWLEDPDNLNPFVGIQGTSYQLWHLNYDYLVGVDAATREPRPELATSWEVSPDGKVWTFKIREGVMWHDGRPVTADDVAFTYNYIIENDLVNATIYTQGIERAEAVDANTVKMYTSHPKADMLALPIAILPEHIWEKVDGKAAGSTYANASPIVGSGPFQVAEWKKGGFVRLEANTDYWRGAPAVDELLFVTYTNADSMLSDVKIGTLQGCIDVPLAQFRELENVDGLTANRGSSWELTNIGMNCYDSPDSRGNPVLLDPTFRQALNWAVDREKVVAQAFMGYAEVGSSLIVPYSRYHWEPAADQAFTYDPDRAKSLLEGAGYKDVNGDGFRETKDGEKLSLRFVATSDTPENTVIAKLCVGWWRDIGVKTVFSVVDDGVLIDAQYNYEGDTFAPDYDLYIWYWTQTDDPNFMLGIFTPDQIEGWNDVCWTDEEYTRLNGLQIRQLDQADRLATAQRMQEVFYESSAYIIPSYSQLLEVYDSGGWEGWVKSPVDGGAVLFNYACIDTYLSVHPVADAGKESESGTSAVVAVGIGAALVIGVVAVLVLRRRRPRALEQ